MSKVLLIQALGFDDEGQLIESEEKKKKSDPPVVHLSMLAALFDSQAEAFASVKSPGWYYTVPVSFISSKQIQDAETVTIESNNEQGEANTQAAS